MVMHGFNTIACTTDNFIEFCERLELSESIYDKTHLKSQKTPTQTSNSGTTPKGGHNKSTRKNSGKNRNQSHYCLYHGQNSSHNTDQCKVVKAQTERMANQHSQKGAGKYKNKFDSDDKNKRKQFQSFAIDFVEKAFKKMKKASSDSSKNKETFSFQDFQNMSVSSDDSSDSD